MISVVLLISSTGIVEGMFSHQSALYVSHELHLKIDIKNDIKKFLLIHKFSWEGKGKCVCQVFCLSIYRGDDE